MVRLLSNNDQRGHAPREGVPVLQPVQHCKYSPDLPIPLSDDPKMGKTSAFIGPIVSSAIIDASPSGNNSLPFYFLFGLSLLSFLLLYFFVDLKKSRREQEVFLAKEKAAKDRRASFVGFSPGRPVEEHDVNRTRIPKAGNVAAPGNGDTVSGSSKSLEGQEIKT